MCGRFVQAADPEIYARTEQRLRTCAILTGQPNATVAPIHDRMPVMLHRDAWATWLDPTVSDPEVLLALLAPVPAADLTARPVSTLVNKVANNLPQLIEPLSTPVAEPLAQG